MPLSLRRYQRNEIIFKDYQHVTLLTPLSKEIIIGRLMMT